jgi:Uncharacterized conserved protein
MSKLKGQLRTKRIYESPSKDDGLRVFVERLWPRGISKERAAIDIWLKDIAPSSELRKWFNHDPSKWDEFKKRYSSEIKDKFGLLQPIYDALKTGNVTLLYASREEKYNAASALEHFLLNSIRKKVK